MKKFILLTFGFLGFAFYQLSGGAEFEPASARMAAAQLAETPAVKVADMPVAAPKPAPVMTADATPQIAPVNNEASVTRVALNLTSLSDIGTAETDATQTPQTAVPQNVAPVSSGTIVASLDTPAIIPSLIMPNDSGAAILEQTTAPANADVREVTGNRVNVRGGPGTNFGVVAKLVRGDAVEILEDNGDGWVRMRPVDGGAEGWMADFLLTGS